MKKRDQIKKVAGVILLALFLLTTSIPITMGEDTYEIRIWTDQEYYYPGEQVLITIQLLKNGEGYPGGVCPEVRDPFDTMIYGGMCYGTDEYGFLYITDFFLDPGAMLGTYLIYVHGFADSWEGYETKTFEVVSETIVAEANGPYQGNVGEPIHFFGDVTGGKPPYTWYWEFGDTGFSYDRNATHTYTNQGTFDALLTVTDQGGRSDSDPAVVIVQSVEYDLSVFTHKPFYFSGDKVLIYGYLTQGGEGLVGQIKITVKNPAQTTVFSDNVPTKETGYYEDVFKLPADAMVGEYTLFVEEEKFEVMNATSFDVYSSRITVDAHGPYEAIINRDIQFIGDAIGGLQPYSWYWDFDDDTNATIQNPTHSYETAGTYTVTLRVNDSYGHIGIDTAQVTITNPVQGNHTVLLEEGTATWCVNCPAVAQILHEMYESGEYDFYYVTLVDDKNQIADERLVNDYNILGYPTVFVDGGYSVVFGDQARTVFEDAIQAASARTVPNINVNLETSWNETTNTIETSVIIQNYDQVPYEGRLRVYLTEINSRWSDNCGNSYHYGFLDYLINEDITIPAGGEIIKLDSTDASGLYPSNLEVIAGVFNATAHDGYANPPDGNRFDAYYTDATVGKRVKEGNLPPEIGFITPKCGRFHFLGKPIFTMPNLNTFLLGRTNITVAAHDDSAIEKVEFYLDGDLKKTLTSEPYEWIWKTPSLFKWKHTITAVAYDDDGQNTTSSIDVSALIFF